MSFWQFGGATNDWNTFRADHKGKGLSTSQLSKMYREQQSSAGKKVGGKNWQYSDMYAAKPKATKSRKSPAKKASEPAVKYGPLTYCASHYPPCPEGCMRGPTGKPCRSKGPGRSKSPAKTKTDAKMKSPAKKASKSNVKYGPLTYCASHYPPCPEGCMRGPTGKPCRKKGAGRPAKNQKGGSLSFSAAQRILQNYMRARYGAL